MAAARPNGIEQALRLLALAQSDLIAGRVPIGRYLTERAAQQDSVVALCAESDIPLCSHGLAISCMRCALRGERCRGKRGNFGFS